MNTDDCTYFTIRSVDLKNHKRLRKRMSDEVYYKAVENIYYPVRSASDIISARIKGELMGWKAEATMNQPTTIKLTGVVRAFDLDDDFFRLSSIETNDFDIREIKCNFEHDVFDNLAPDEKPWNLMEKKVTVECEYIPKSRSVDVLSIAHGGHNEDMREN